MGTFRSLEEARAFFEQDRFATENGAVIEELGENWSVCGMDVRPGHRNAAGGLMGGAAFLLCDFAFAVAANNVHRLTVAQQVSINFLNPLRGSRLTARAACRKDGRVSCVYTVDITDDTGRDIAQAVVTGFKLNSPAD